MKKSHLFSLAFLLLLSGHQVMAAAAGPPVGCVGEYMYFADDAGITGGVWSSSNTAIVTINSGTGVAMAHAVGTSIISYTVGSSTTTVTVATSPFPVPITASTIALSPGMTETLTDATAGGTWSSSNTSVATIDPSTGVLTAVANGTAAIYYHMPGCGQFLTIGVYPVGVENINMNAPIHVYPNPAYDKININWDIVVTEATDISVVDMTGRVVYHSVIESDMNIKNTIIGLGQPACGSYVIRIKSASTAYTQLLQLQR